MILFSCRRVAELTSKELDDRLRLAERLGVGVHRLGCAACRRFRDQAREVERAVAEYVRADSVDGEEGLPVGTKSLIVERLKASSADAANPDAK